MKTDFMKDCKMVNLGDVCEFSRDKISANYLNKYNYIGVENLLPDKKGKINSTCVPSNGNLTKFEKYNILIGNIRPYLKKIWFADISGGANGDVLVIKIKNNNLIPKFIFYVLSSDTFFNYDMQNAKGTKMPRGSKTAIMNFQIPVPPPEIQQKIAGILSTQDKIIELKQNLINQKKLQKKYLMQNLLTKKIRLRGFEGEWKKKEFNEIFNVLSSKKHQIKSTEYKTTGSYPVIDQGEKKIAGYSDNSEKLLKCSDDGVIVFGDHTRKIKFINFDFIIGADGTQILVSKNDMSKNIFLYYTLLSKKIKNSGYSRHFKYIKEFIYYLPSIEEQTAIAEFLSAQDKEIELLEKQLENEKLKKKALMQLLLKTK